MRWSMVAAEASASRRCGVGDEEGGEVVVGGGVVGSTEDGVDGGPSGGGGGRWSWILLCCLQNAGVVDVGGPVGGFRGYRGVDSAECGRAGKAVCGLLPVVVVVVKRGTALLVTGNDVARGEGEEEAASDGVVGRAGSTASVRWGTVLLPWGVGAMGIS